jgi:sodium transport system permease protein
VNLRTVRTIFFKEVVDALRDRRTLVAMIGVPVVLYPALFIFVSQTAIITQTRLAEQVSRVAVEGDGSAVLTPWLEEAENLQVIETGDGESAIAEGDLDALVVVGDPAVLEQGESLEVEIQFDATEEGSRQAQERVRQALLEKEEKLLLARLNEVQLDKSYVEPLAIRTENVAPPEKLAGSILGMIVPMIMVVMVGLGAFYPAVDLTAGEKERGTFETLLTTPAGRLEIVTGKFLTVFSLATFTGLLNVGSIMLVLAFQVAQLPEDMSETLQISLPPSAAALMVLVLIPLAFFISAAMMDVAVFARSFKEAQNFVSPFFIAITFPAALAAVPGFELNAVTQVIPVAGAALLYKELLVEGAAPEQIFAVLITTTAYALLALLLAGWLFQREDVVLNEEGGMALSLRRSELTPKDQPSVALSLFIFVVCLLLFFYLGQYAQSRDPLSGLLFSLWVVVLLPPIVILWLRRVNLREALFLRLPAPRPAAASLLMMLSWPLVLLELSVWHGRFLPIPPGLEEQFAQPITDIISRIGFGGALFVLAASPAICEEVLFRGAVLSGLKRRLPVWAGCLVVALLFGFMHLNVYRFALTAASGLVLAYMVWRSASLFTGVLGHFLVNATALFLASQYARDGAIREYIAGPIERGEGMNPVVVLPAAAVFISGFILMELTTKPSGKGVV